MSETVLAEIVDGKGLAKAGLGVPEVFSAGVAVDTSGRYDNAENWYQC